MAMQAWTRWRGGCVACLLLGALLLPLLTTECSLPADDAAKPAALPADLAKVPSDAVLLVSGRIADLWSNDRIKELLKPFREKHKNRIDDFLNQFQKRLGLPLEQIERMTLVVLTPDSSSHEPLLFVRTGKPYDVAKVSAAAETGKVKKYKGETLYVETGNAGDKAFTIYPLDDRSLVYGVLREMQALIDHPQPNTEGNLAAALRLAAGKHSMVLGMNVKLFNDSVADRLPKEVTPFRPLLEATSATLAVDFAAESRAAAVLAFATKKDAKAAIQPAEKGMVLLRTSLDRALTQVSKYQGAVTLFGLLKQFQDRLKAAHIEQKGASLNVALAVNIDSNKPAAALVEEMRKLRAAAVRAENSNNLRQIALGMMNYADTYGGRLPAHAIYSKNGKPLLSWRVWILPYIEQQNLYNQFHLNEPWDSEHNKKLLALMPKTYASPSDEKTLQKHTTYYQAFVGEGAFFEGKQGLQFPADFPDGTSNTIMIVEASKAVPWSKPVDIPFDRSKRLPKLGLPGAPGFLAALCDGSVRMISHKITKETLRNAITRNDGNILGPDF